MPGAYATLLNPQQVIDYMAAARAKGRVRKYPFTGKTGLGYSQNDPHAFPMGPGLSYDETLIFGDPNAVNLSTLPNSDALQALNQTIANSTTTTTTTTTAAPSSTQLAGPYGFNITPFVAGVTTGNIQVLPANSKRQALLVQNQDAAITMWFNLGSNAAPNFGVQLAPGFGMLFEIKVPNNYVTVVATGTMRGIVAEGQ